MTSPKEIAADAIDNIMKKAYTHDMYWGSHGCMYVRGHAHPCRCDCGEWYQGSETYGEDAATAVAIPEGWTK